MHQRKDLTGAAIPEIGMSGQERRVAGCIVTFESATGERWTTHATGNRREALQAVCAAALARDETFLIVAISTPQTIFSDLVGRRPQIRPDHPIQTATVNLPEQILAGVAGVKDMLHPRLRASAGERRAS